MGQKSNLITLRKKNLFLNLATLNPENFIYFFKFLTFLERLFELKGVYIINRVLNLNSNKCFYYANFFYKSKISSIYKKKISKKTLNFTKDLNTKTLQNLFKESLNKFTNNVLIFNIENLNISVKKPIFLFFYKRLKKFIKTIFSRRFNLFVDFLKINSLFVKKFVGAASYIKFLTIIFNNISKKFHYLFLSFLKILFKSIIYDLPKFKKLNCNNILGIRFSISGRLRDKPRASSLIIDEGLVPNQSFNKSIDFSKSASHTLMGVFGLKLWVHNNKK